MRFSNRAGLRQQVQFLQRQFLQDGNLPFTDVLSAQVVSQALIASEVVWKERIYTPLVTLWVFLSQILSVDHSCRASVARLITHRLSRGESSCSAETGAYCQARKRLPEEFFADIAQRLVKILMRALKRIGFGKTVACTCSMAQLFRCPIQMRIKSLIRNTIPKNLAWVFQWLESPPSFRFHVERLSIWEFAVTQARGKARLVCSALCGISFNLAMLYSPIACIAPGGSC